ncbi:MAG: sigma-70 family RNA polymerase sigma factor [Clostridiales bacterium]|jgi:RNA polymerase sporulation-specific sigma factor|nr:sigma-70 family RNA polymerase sigma factor [Clostridiales bacterium]
MNEIIKNNPTHAKYNSLTDEDIINFALKGDTYAENFIINKYKNTVYFEYKRYFLNGGDFEDLKQEGMIGIFNAIKNFNIKKNISFKNFMKKCIYRRIITAIKTANRKKHTPLNNCLSYNNSISHNEDKNKTAYEKLIQNKKNDPEEIMINKENFSIFKKNIKKILSKLEKKTFILYIRGMNYNDIAVFLKKNPKSIDNAIQRIKKKFVKFKVLDIFN